MNNQELIKRSDVAAMETKRKFLYGTGCLFELTKWIIVLVILITLIHYFLVTIFIVDGLSMYPNFNGGEYILTNRWQYYFSEFNRGDVVVLHFPGDPDRKKYIKRIIGIPSDRIKVVEGEVYVNGRKLHETYLPSATKTYSEQIVDRVLGPDEYFLMGDNRDNSSDSRIWGVANKRHLIGRAWVEFFPKWKIIHEVDYSTVGS